MPGLPPATGRTTFDWMLRPRYLVQQASADHPDAPDGHMIITAGPGAATGYLQHYFDSRGVVRLYEMDVDGQDWTLTRTTRRLHARWTSRSAGSAGSATTATPSRAGGRPRPTASSWQLDFRLTYRRTEGGGQG